MKIQFATIAYFYAGPGAKVEPGVPDLSGRKVYPKPPIKREPGVIEAENLKVKAKTAGDVPNQDMIPFGDAWSAGNQLWWVVHEPERQARPGAARSRRPAPTRSRRPSPRRATTAPCSSPSTASRSASPSTCSSPLPAVVHTGDVPLGTATLDAGPHTLSITLTGQEPEEHQLPRRHRLGQAHSGFDGTVLSKGASGISHGRGLRIPREPIPGAVRREAGRAAPGS